MTLMFGTVVAFAAGLALGRRWQAFALAGVAWYAFLAIQTAYLAVPGHISFDGGSGLKTLQHTPYWIVQPPILGLSIALLFVGALLHTRISLLVRTWRGTAPTSA